MQWPHRRGDLSQKATFSGRILYHVSHLLCEQQNMIVRDLIKMLDSLTLNIIWQEIDLHI